MSEINYQSAFDLVSRIVQNGEGENSIGEMGNLSKIINELLPDALKDNAPANFPELYTNFKYTFEKFTDFIVYEKLIGKNTIALGGAFSSGKSSFLNSIMGSSILPSEIDPSTSVPTYIINGKEDIASGINVFHKKIDLKIEEVKIISHGYFDEYSVKFGHLLETIFIETPKSSFDLIAFLDTPGYSKPDSDKYSKRTDEHIARTQLNSSNFILWFVSVEEGTISEEDIRFIQSLNSEIPFAVIVNKCDKKTESDVIQITQGIKTILENKGIFPKDVIPYSCRKPKQYGLEKVIELFKDWNNSDYVSTFARDFKILFIKCSEYFDEMLRNENRRLNWINAGMTFSDIVEVNDAFRSLSNEIKIFFQRYKEKSKKLKELQNDFFSEIKKVGEKYGIEMPEPSEIDLIQNKTTDLLQILREIKEKQKIKSHENYHILMDKLNKKNNLIAESIGHKDYPIFTGRLLSKKIKTGNNRLSNCIGDSRYPESVKRIINEKAVIKRISTTNDIIKSALSNPSLDLSNICKQVKIEIIKSYLGN